MRELFRCMKAEVIKMRHTFLYPVHSVPPVLGSGIFLLYYRVSGGSDAAQISGYMEVVGIALPFVISMICAENVELESKNHFQVFLGGAGCRFNAFLAKYLVLAGIGFMAVLAAVMLFAAGFQWGLAKKGILFHAYGKLAVILCLGSAPLYLEHLFLNLMFSKPVSLCAGIVEFLLSALFLTGLGDGRWYFFPCTWSARGAAAYLAVLFV
ncbi:MAG: lantibiotic immunity ABC transporter MutG family permease subunit [Lachnospiraceae bacterium]|nr:lantibiotic immunity ABC transporter MutG family permease subunit [Lachnospiraceae bacterium]